MTGARRQQGFTLIEILVVVAIIGIIAALLTPNFISSLHKAKQRRTMADMHEIGSALSAWLVDQVAAAAAGAQATQFDLAPYGSPIDATALEKTLVPAYIGILPKRDSWRHRLEFYLRSDNLNADQIMAIRSPARDGKFMDPYAYGAFPSTDFEQDLVWADGTFVRWPGSN